MHGFLVAIEGSDGTGKSTATGRVAVRLRSVLRGAEVVETREPGSTTLGARVRPLILDGETPPSPLAEVLLFAADRAEHVARVVRPALERGAVVVTDRFVESSVAYQSAGRGVAEDVVRHASSIATGGLAPDLTVLLVLDRSDARARLAARRGGLDEIERAGEEFFARVEGSFLSAAAREPERFAVVDAGGDEEDVADRVLVEVLAALARRALDPGARP